MTFGGGDVVPAILQCMDEQYGIVGRQPRDEFTQFLLVAAHHFQELMRSFIWNFARQFVGSILQLNRTVQQLLCDNGTEPFVVTG